MSRRKVIIIGSVIALGVGLGFALPRVGFYLLTGRVFPIHRIDALTSAVEVRGWDAEGLRLADGRRIQLPEFRKLPVESAALAEATKRGVEISPNGRVYGLVRVHHWCGNDPVREHIARLDLSEMLTFLRDGERVSPPSDPDMLAYEPGGRFSEWGWRVGEFLSFDRYSKNFAANKSLETNRR